MNALPGHPYNGRLQSGIKLDKTRAAIYLAGELKQSVTLARPVSAWQFWYEGMFVPTFPTVSHWWFFSGWTQHVRLRVLARHEGGSHGLMQFASEDNPGQLWFYDQGAISLPYPAGEEFPGNVPLRLTLGRMVYETAVLNQHPQDQWVPVTSLVAAAAVERVFPLVWTAPWWPDKVYDKNNMRGSFCALLGLRPA